MAAFGRFVARWSRLEFELGCLFVSVIDRPAQQALMIYYSSSGFAAHRDLLNAAIAPSFRDTPPKELTDLLSAAETMNTIRNDLIHGEWSFKSAEEAAIRVFKPRAKGRSYIFDVAPDLLETWSDEVNEFIGQIYDLRTSIDHEDKNSAD